MKHLQERVDRSITTKGEGKNLYDITIDYKSFKELHKALWNTTDTKTCLLYLIV